MTELLFQLLHAACYFVNFKHLCDDVLNVDSFVVVVVLWVFCFVFSTKILFPLSVIFQ